MTKKISQLPAATSVDTNDEFVINQDGTTKKLTTANPWQFSNVNIDGGNIDGTAIGASSASSGAFTNLSYTGTLTGGTGVVNIGSGQIYKDANGNVGVGIDTPEARLSFNVPSFNDSQQKAVIRFQSASSNHDAYIQSFDVSSEGSHLVLGSNFNLANAGNFVAPDVTSASCGIDLNRTGIIDIYTGLSGSPAPRMRIDSSGNVGVGTTAPIAITNQTSCTVNGTNAGRFDVRVGGAHIAQFLATSTFANVGSLTSLPLTFSTNNTERMRIDSSGNVGIGTTAPSTASRLTVQAPGNNGIVLRNNTAPDRLRIFVGDGTGGYQNDVNYIASNNTPLIFIAGNPADSTNERMRIDSSGSLLVGKTAFSNTEQGIVLGEDGQINVVIKDAGAAQQAIFINRQDSDGTLILFRQGNSTEGSISVSGSTVSYNGGHLSRWSQLPDNTKDDSIVKGTVMTNLDEMAEWVHEDGTIEDNEQLNRMTVSDVEGDPNVAGVFVNWDDDDDMNIAMTGDMVIRIAQGVTVQRGDLLMSAGDGTAKPQGDDIVRSKTIAKVTSTHVSHTYDDGSYLVPCVLMAC